MAKEAPATVAAIQHHVGNVSTANAWELADAQGTVGKRATSSLEVSASDAKSLGFLNFERPDTARFDFIPSAAQSPPIEAQPSGAPRSCGRS